MTTILDPTDERVPVARQLATRADEINGRVAFLDISKPRGSVLLDELERQLNLKLPKVEITRYSKPTFAKPAPDDLRMEIKANSDFVIEALAD